MAHAQDTGDSSVVTEEKIVVEGQQPVDAASTVVSRPLDRMESAAGESWGAIAGGVANFQTESGGPDSFGGIFTLRGLANTPYFSDAAVGLYFDDIPLGSAFTYPTDLFGFASATLFLGPQGTVFGRAGEGGVFELRLPESAAAWGGELGAGAGDYEAASVDFESSGPVGGHGDAMVAAAYTEREGYITNTQIGRKVDDERALTALARLRFHPTPAGEISLEVLAGRHRDGAQPLVPLGGPLYTVQRAQEGETDTDMLGAALKASFDTGAGRLTAVTSFTDWRLDPYDDWLVLPPPLQSHLTQSQETWNEELHLASEPGGRLAWDVGAWFSDSRTLGAADRSIFGAIPYEVSDYHDTACDSAVFGSLVFAPAPGWQASLGLRAEDAAKDYYQDEQVPTAGVHYHFERSDNFVLPKIAINRAIARGLAAHVSISLGSKSGGFSPYTFNPALIPFAAEHAAAFEAGVDDTLANDRLTLSARVFDTEITNCQIERSFSPADYFVATAPRARSLGAEIGAQWRPAANWTLAAVAGITDVTLREFDDPITGRSYAGDRAPYAPAFTSDLSLAYGARRGIFGRVDLVARGRTFYTEDEDPLYSQGAYAVLNARLGYEAGRWRLSLYFDNITGRGYYALIIPGVNSASPGPPFTFGSELVLKF